MQYQCKVIFASLLIVNCSCSLFGQDTLIYQGFVAGSLLYESIELYPDKTFKWTSEYDLFWSEYGLYEIDNNKVKLKFYIFSYYPTTMSLKDSIMKIDKLIKVENFKIEKERLYRLNKFGHKIHRIRDGSIRTFWSWLFGYRYEIRK